MKLVAIGLLASLFLIILFVAGQMNEWQKKDSQRKPTGDIMIREQDPSQGPVEADITIAYFSSFTCQACRQSALTMEQVQALYPNKVRVVRKDLPLDELNARNAALAARCAQLQGKFWQYHDQLFNRQQEVIEGDQALWSDIASDIGLESKIFSRCLEDRATLSLIEQDIADAVVSQATAVPYFQLRVKEKSRLVEEDIPLVQWRQLIDSLQL